MVRAQALRLVSLPLWHALSPGRLQLELHAHEALAKHWKAAAKKEAKAAAKKAKAGEGAYVPLAQRPDVRFLPGLLDEFLEVLDKVRQRGGCTAWGLAARRCMHTACAWARDGAVGGQSLHRRYLVQPVWPESVVSRCALMHPWCILLCRWWCPPRSRMATPP